MGKNDNSKPGASQVRRYYARTFGNNKEIWKSLRTDHLSVAKARLAEFLREQREKQASTANHSSAKMTFAEALAIHLQNLADNVEIKPSTRHYWRQIFVALLKSWPGLAEREVRRITKTECTDWAQKFRKAASSTRYNNTIAGLRHVCDVASRAGIVYGNPAAELKRVKIRQKSPTFPSRVEFFQLVERVERAGAWCSRDCADFLRGLASQDAARGKPRKSDGTTWISGRVKLLCVAMQKPARRAGWSDMCR